jgi:hypothetical protein
LEVLEALAFGKSSRISNRSRPVHAFKDGVRRPSFLFGRVAGSFFD